jgi:tetratricopeptide (TPR) repeat protein
MKKRESVKSICRGLIAIIAVSFTMQSASANVPENAAFWKKMEAVHYSYIQDHDYAKALDFANNWIVYGKHLSMGYMLRCETYAFMKDYQKALQDANKSLELDPSNEGAWVFRGIIYKELGNHAKAIESYQGGLAHLNQQEGSGSLEHQRIGFIYEEDHNYSDAIREYNEAARLEPKACSDTIYLRGCALEDAGRYQEALADFAYVLRYDKGFIAAMQRSAIIYEKLGNAAEAKRYWTLAACPPSMPERDHSLVSNRLTDAEVIALRINM